MTQNLYVGNLSYQSEEGEIRQLFEEIGATVTQVNIITDRDTGRPRGFGFVEVESEEDATKAIEALNEKNFGGRTLTVSVARPRASGGAGGGGGGGQRRDNSSGGRRGW